MAQTKRKRRTKHRGNAAGSIEARGRTGRKPDATERKKGGANAREDRRLNEPTWSGAATRAGMAAVLLFVLFQLGGLRARGSRAPLLPALRFCSSGVSLRPVRPRVSIEPAALPRCLVRLLRFVWAMWTYEVR